MQQTLTRLWVRYRTVFKIAFFALLALGLYLGMRPTPAPASYNWQATFYHMAGLFSLTLLSSLLNANPLVWLFDLTRTKPHF